MHKTWCVLLAGVVAGLTLGTAWAQLLPEIGGTAATLARGDAGLATTNEEATGSVNAAALPLLFQIRATTTAGEDKTASRHSRLAGGPTPFLSQPGDGTIRLAYRPPSRLADVPEGPLFALGEPKQVLIESHFVALDQSFMRNLGVQQGAWGHLAGVSLDLDSEHHDLFGVHYSGGPLGGDWGVGTGYTRFGDFDFPYVAAGKVLARDGDRSLVSAGAKVSWNGIGPEPERTTFDLALLGATRARVLSRPAIVTVSGRVVDITNEYGFFPDTGRRLDIGGAVSTENVRVMVDLVDVGNSTQIPHVAQTGRRLNIGTEVAVTRGGTICLLAGLADGEFSVGARGKVPFLKDIPYIGWAIGHRDEETRAELLIFLTPRIIENEGE